MSLVSYATHLRDSLFNLVSGLGTAKDPRTSTNYAMSYLDRSVLEIMYRTDWLARKIVDAPAEDATREWRTWLADKNQVTLIEKLERKLEIQRKVREALIRARLYGGAALVLGVNQGMPDEELDLNNIDKDSLRFVVVLNRYELNAGPRIYNVDSPYYTRPEYYTVATPMFGFQGEAGGTHPANGSSANNVYTFPYGQSPPNRFYTGSDKNLMVQPPSGMITIHPSRVVEFAGNELPDWRLAPMGGGWGDPVLQTVEDALKDFGLITSGIASLVNDMKMDVVKIPELSRKLSTTELSSKLLERFTLANTAKSSINTLLLDSEEEWNRIQTSFGSTPQLIEVAIKIACAAGGIPESRAMGSAPSSSLSAKGSSGGEIDIQNYYDSIAADQNGRYKPKLLPLDVCLTCSALGKSGIGIDYIWNPLLRPSPSEEAALALQKAQATQVYVGTGLLNEDALRQALINQLIEDDVYPGLDDAIDKFGAEPEEPEPESQPEPPPGMMPKGQFEANPFAMLKAQAGKLPPGKPSPPGKGLPPPNPKPKLPAKDFDPDEPRDETGKWTSGGADITKSISQPTISSSAASNYGLVPGDVAKFHALKDQWAQVNNHLLSYVDRPDSPEAKADMDQLEKISKEIHGLHADPGTAEGIGLPGGPRDVTIIGAGPGGLAASIFGGAEGLDTMVVESNAVAGGQARYSSRIENFPGFPVGVTGENLTKSMFEQAARLGADERLGVRVTGMTYDEKTGLKHLTLSNGESVDSRTVILAGGVEFRRPHFPGADGPGVIVGDGKSLTQQSAGGNAVVLGGSNGAAQAALGAATKANHVWLISRSPITKGMSDYQVAAVHNQPKITIVENDNVAKLNRDASNNIESVETTNGQKIPAKALGVFLGSVPETNWLAGKVNRDETGRITTDAKLETNLPGVFAVGDMRNGAIGRIGVAVGEGQLALREANVYLENLRHKTKAADSAALLDEDQLDDLITRLFALDRENPYFGQTVEKD